MTTERIKKTSNLRKIIGVTENALAGVYVGFLGSLLGAAADSTVIEAGLIGALPAVELYGAIKNPEAKDTISRKTRLTTYGVGAATGMALLNYLQNR